MAINIWRYTGPLLLTTFIGSGLLFLTWNHMDTFSLKTPTSQRPSSSYSSSRDFSRSCPSILDDDKYVRNCVTGDVIGEIPGNLEKKPLELLGRESLETSNNRKHAFKKVFDNRLWGEGKDPGLHASGGGSTMSFSQEMMAILHSVISEVRVRHNLSKVRLLDAPCGDMAWMSRFLQTRDDVQYTGVDIVPDLIQHHRREYGNNPRMQFMVADLVEVPLNGTYDVILNRMALQHLMLADAQTILKKFSSSARYLLTTTHMSTQHNGELVYSQRGRFRALNMEIPPISLTPPLCLQRDGPPGKHAGGTHFIGLWTLPLTVHANCKTSSSFNLHNTMHKVYSCVKWE